jgi:hypothetical protein
VILKKMNYKVKGLLPLFFLLAFLGCKKESTNVGLELIGDGISRGESDTTFFASKVRTVESDSLPTSRLPSNILGVVRDPVFGLSKASLVVQPRLKEVGVKLAGNTIDSIRFNLNYDLTAGPMTLGDINSEIAIDIYKLDQSVSIDSVYTHRFNPQLGEKIGEFVGKFDLSNKQVIIGDDTTTVSPKLSVLLNNSFGQELIDAGDDKFTDNQTFLSYLKGIVLVPRDNPLSGEGAIVAVQAYSELSGLEMYYHSTEDTGSMVIPMGNNSVRINAYETTRSAEILTQQMVDGSYSKGYLQSLGGTKLKIGLNDLSSFIELGEQIVINEASIEFIADESVVAGESYPLPPSLILSIPSLDVAGNPLSNSAGFVDFGATYYGGKLDGSSYLFRFTGYLQQLITEYNASGKNNFHGFFLSVPTASPIRPDRTVINTDVAAKEVKVSITYTKLN